MPALRTLPTSDVPRVVFLGQNPELLKMVENLYSAHEIDVLAISYSELLQLDNSTLNSDSIYKLVWWVSLDDTKLPLILERLSTSPLLSIVVMGVVPETIIPDHLRLESKQKRHQKLWVEINEKLPKSQLFWSRDLFLNSPPPSLEMFFVTMDKKVLLDFQIEVFLTDVSDYFKVLTKNLMSPHKPKKIVIQGKKRLSSSLIKEIRDTFFKYYQKNFSISSGVGKRLSPDMSGFLKVVVKPASISLVDELVRNYPKWKTKIPKISEKKMESWKEMGKLLSQVKKKKNVKPELKEVEKVIHKPVPKPISRQTLVKVKKQAVLKTVVDDGLSRIFKQRREVDKTQRLEKKTEIVNKISDKSKKNKVLFMGGMGVMGIGGIVLLLFLVLSISSFFIKRDIIKSFEKPQELLEEGFKTGFWNGFLKKQVALYSLVLGEGALASSQDLVNFYEQSRALVELKQGLNKSSTNYVLEIVGKRKDKIGSLEKLKAGLNEVLIKTQELEESLISISPDWFSENESGLEDFKTLITVQKQRLLAAKQTSELFNQIWGSEGKRNYALVLQNNLELRATGGFIQAIALLTFDNGLLIDTQIKSVYELDNQLLGEVEAPREIKKYLGEENWYLRDGNWDSDFPTAAKRITWFIDESLGKSVDGVFAMDYLVMRDILEALGPVELLEFQEIITAKNLLERVEFHSDDELVNKNTGEGGYFLALFSQFLDHLMDVSLEKNPGLGLAIYNQLEKSNLLIEIFSEDEQVLFKKLGWNGEIVDPVCPAKFPGTNCLVDQVYQVESNIGVNRVNDYIDREVTHEVDLTGDRVKNKRIITFKNKSKTDGWPLGTYRTYLKFILSEKAKPKTLKINGERVSSQRILTYTEEGRRVVGVSLEIPKQTTKTVELEYETKEIVEPPFSYLLFNQKQPGLESTPTTISIYHEGYKPSLIAPKADIFGDTLEFMSEGEQHLFIGVSLE